MRSKILFIILFLAFNPLISLTSHALKKGSVIFIHPDGTGLGLWTALRLEKVGPNGNLHWDKLDKISLYINTQTNFISSTSHAGATAHSYGKKVHWDSFGMDFKKELKSLSGKPYSIMIEAHKAQIPVGIINSGHMAESGTAVFLASSPDRGDTDFITETMLKQNIPLILNGGEALLLPKAMKGFHGVEGKRKDGKNLIQKAKNFGYSIVYNKKQLKRLNPHKVKKVLGLFAANNTFNDAAEETLKAEKLPTFSPNAPTLSEMINFALKFLSHKSKHFFLVVEEEGTDNFSNKLNARGALDALSRADDAIGTALNYMANHQNISLLVASDSDAGHPTACNHYKIKDQNKTPSHTRSGAFVDGINGNNSNYFVSKPDKLGRKYRFAIAWATKYDMPGGLVARFHGLNSEIVPNKIHNTDIYRFMYATLFGKLFPWE